MIRTQIQLTEEQWQALKKLAASRRVSMAELIRQSVDLLVQTPEVVSIQEKRRKALEVVGKFHSDGPTDLAEKHDDHLAESYTA